MGRVRVLALALFGAWTTVACGDSVFRSVVSDDAGADDAIVPDDATVGGDAAGSDASTDDGPAPLDGGGHLIVFVTTQGFDVATTASADTRCANEAANRVPGRFVAWFSGPGVPAATRLVDGNGRPVDGPWFRLDGKRVVASRQALLETLTTPLENAISITATGTTTGATVWTGTYADGGVGRSCPDQAPTVGVASSGDAAWTSEEFFTATCGSNLALYCFQVD